MMKIKGLVGLGLASLLMGASVLPASATIQDGHEMNNSEVVQGVQAVQKHEYFAYFDKLLEKYKNEIDFEEKVYTANSYHDLFTIIQDVEETLPDKFEIQSKYMTVKQLREEYDKAMALFVADSIMNHHTLVSYKRVPDNKKLVFDQMSNEKGYSARHISAALDEFTDFLANELKVDEKMENHLEQSILNVYDFIFDNYAYKARGIAYMQVGNLSSGEMACNGFSRLAYEVLNKMGIATEIRGGYSHFWNVITLDDQQQITFDVTTDILLKEKGKTLGNDTSTHIKNTAPVGIYSAEYREWQYKEVANYDFVVNKLSK